VRRGWRIGIHALGDRTVRSVLDAFEQVVSDNPGLPPGTLTIEHAFLADTTQRVRASRLGVGITVQQPLLYAQGAQLLAGWGEERMGQILPIRGWLEVDAQVSAGSSDSPPTAFDPMQAIWGMVTRGTKQVGVQGAEQAITGTQPSSCTQQPARSSPSQSSCSAPFSRGGSPIWWPTAPIPWPVPSSSCWDCACVHAGWGACGLRSRIDVE
jgi:Amidohydrolase family